MIGDFHPLQMVLITDRIEVAGFFVANAPVPAFVLIWRWRPVRKLPFAVRWFVLGVN